MLSAENITKRFPGVLALDQVCLELHPGKVNAVIGENGAGKSTLMKILSGVYDEYEGNILLNAKKITFSNPKEAEDAGIAIIHQELNLVPYQSITENIFLGREMLTKWGTLNKKGMREKAKDLLKKLNLRVDPDTLVDNLKVGQQQLVEIAKALLTNAEVIIMDEPTSAISDSEVDILFDLIGQLKKENKTIVYISHKLSELFRIADRYVIMRDGKTIESGEMNVMTHQQIINKMVGREINITHSGGNATGFAERIRLENICLAHADKNREPVLKNISFTAGKGEIVGIFGLMGAGRTELLETVFGLHAKRMSGTVSINHVPVSLNSPAEAISAGIALVPEDRKKDGLVLGLNVKNNIALTTLPNLETYGMLNQEKERSLAQKYIADLKIKTSSEKEKVKNLSGGNQQKVVLAKWLATDPAVLMLDEPTRGVDIHSKLELYKVIKQLAENGMCILLVSSEMQEILTVSHRILVLCEGRLTAEIPADQATENNILSAAIPKNG